MFLKISSEKLNPIFFSTYDGFRAVTINMTNIYLVNAEVSPDKISVQVTSPSYLYVIFYDFIGNLQFNYQEKGFAMNKTGIAAATMNNANLIFNLSIFESNSVPQVTMQYLELNVTSLTSNLTLNAKVKQQMETQLVRLLQNQANRAFSDAYQSKINLFLKNFNYFPNIITGKPLVLDISWAENEVISSEEYIAFIYNGTILPQTKTSQLISDLSPPVEMPTRIYDEKSRNNTQIFISEYMLNSFY